MYHFQRRLRSSATRRIRADHPAASASGLLTVAMKIPEEISAKAAGALAPLFSWRTPPIMTISRPAAAISRDGEYVANENRLNFVSEVEQTATIAATVTNRV